MATSHVKAYAIVEDSYLAIDTSSSSHMSIAAVGVELIPQRVPKTITDATMVSRRLTESRMYNITWSISRRAPSQISRLASRQLVFDLLTLRRSIVLYF